MVLVSTTHNRLARCKKVAAVDCHSKRPTAMQLINHTVKKFKTSTTTCDARLVTPPLPPSYSLSYDVPKLHGVRISITISKSHGIRTTRKSVWVCKSQSCDSIEENNYKVERLGVNDEWNDQSNICSVFYSSFGVKDIVCPTIMTKYMALVAFYPKMHAVVSSVPQSTARSVSSNSIQATGCFLFVTESLLQILQSGT